MILDEVLGQGRNRYSFFEGNSFLCLSETKNECEN